jgi:hypothetical protein
MDIPKPRPGTLITRYLKCCVCFATLGRYTISYENGHYALMTDVEDIPQEKFCKKCMTGLRGTKVTPVFHN